MSAPAVDAIMDQALGFMNAIVDSYEVDIAAGEVGIGGSCRASQQPILAAAPPTCLVYGRVQSGKTAAMILTAALAFDNGFRTVVVLTADNVELVRQTADRFRSLDGPRVLSSADESEWTEAERQNHGELNHCGLVLVCAKNASRIQSSILFLNQIDAASYPSIIFDDEADAATPDTTLRARTAGRSNAPSHASTINRRVIRNDRVGEEGESVLEVLPHSMYVQVTATPYVLLLQRRQSTLHPARTLLLEPGEGYCGGERFFSGFDSEDASVPDPPVVLVDEQEHLAFGRRAVPPALASSIEFMLVAAAACSEMHNWPRGGYKHLSHQSLKKNQHYLVANHIERHLAQIRSELRGGEESPLAVSRFRSAYAELLRSHPSAPALEQLMPTIAFSARHAQVFRINSETDRPSYGPRVNFLVGGNILGRGLTIDNLLVTYYLRQAQVSQMDTVLQHARMYGYRESLMPFTRVYLTWPLALLFKQIDEAESLMRDNYARQQRGEDGPIRLPTGARPTRPGALEGNERVYQGRQGQIAPHMMIRDPLTVREVTQILNSAGVPFREERENRTTAVPLNTIYSLIEQLTPESDDPGPWEVDAMLGLMNVHESACNGNGYVYVRPFDQSPNLDRSRARLSGIEVEIIRQASPHAPALALLYWEDSRHPELWYPTLVVPRNMPTYIYGPS